MTKAMKKDRDLDWFVAQLKASVAARRADGAGMTEIAFKCGISTQMLYAYLRGEGEPKIGAYDRMAHYFGWTPLHDPREAPKL